MRMHIFVDADACPAVGIVENIAKKHNISVTLLCDTNHVLHYPNCSNCFVISGCRSLSSLRRSCMIFPIVFIVISFFMYGFCLYYIQSRVKNQSQKSTLRRNG